MPTSTDLVTDLPADFETFGQAVATSMADLLGGTTGQVLSKASNTDMDFTWVAQDDSNAIQNAIVDAKGDLIAASAADTPARLAVGANGETLVADSSASTGLRYQSNFAAGKNAIINGAFNVWQRGTTFTPTAGGGINTVDRFWQQFDVAPTTGSITQQTFTPGTAPVSGYEGQYFYRTTITTPGSSSYYILGQRIEDVRNFAGQTVTVSFWAKLNSGAISSARIRLTQNFGSGGSASVTQDNSYNYTPTGTWQRFSWTIAIPSISGKTVGTSSYLQVDTVVAYTAANTVDTWGWQVEAGSVATAFQTATGTIQGELSAAQRYYQKSYAQGVALATTTTNGAASWVAQAASPNARSNVRFPVTMRTTSPTITLYSTNTGATGKVYNEGATADQTGTVQFQGDQSFNVYISAGTVSLGQIINFHYTADNEL
jgi:hypothetical protein